MNAFSRSKRHISMDRVKKMHEEKYQRQLLAEKKEEKRQNKIQEITKSEAMDWRSEVKESVGWMPVKNGPTNSVTAMYQGPPNFSWDGDEKLTTVQINAIGGIDDIPDAVPFTAPPALQIPGFIPDPSELPPAEFPYLYPQQALVPTPAFSDAPVQGYTKPLGANPLVKRNEKEEEERYKKVEELNDKIRKMDKEFYDYWNSITDENTPEFDAARRKHETKKDIIAKQIDELLWGKSTNKKLDSSQTYVQKTSTADVYMGARVQDAKPVPSFTDKPPSDPTVTADTPTDDVLDKVADAFGVGTAKDIFDYHMNWNKTQDPSPQDVTNLVSSEDKKLLQDLVNRHASNATDELVELGINSDLQHTIGLSQGLRNSLGVLDASRGDGAKVEGNNIVIRKAYDFEGGFVGGATGLTGVAAALYGMTQGAFSKTGAMDMVIRIPLRKKRRKSKGVKENRWDKIKTVIRG